MVGVLFSVNHLTSPLVVKCF